MNHLRFLPTVLFISNFLTSMLWSAVWNTLDRSIKSPGNYCVFGLKVVELHGRLSAFPGSQTVLDREYLNQVFV